MDWRIDKRVVRMVGNGDISIGMAKELEESVRKKKKICFCRIVRQDSAVGKLSVYDLVRTRGELQLY